MHTKKPIFLKSLMGLFFAISLGFVIFQRSGKHKSEFQTVSGRLTSLTNINEGFPNLDTAKFRYLEVAGYPKTIELFIGKGSGDFRPQFERIDDLKINDQLTIYFDESSDTRTDPINRLVYFIDRGKEPIFIKGDWEKYLAYVVWGICAATLAALIVLREKGKIE